MRRKVAELEDLSKATLSAYAQGLGLKFSTTLKKEELLAMLLESTDLQLHTLMELTIADDQKVVSIKRFEAPPDQATTAVASTAEAAIATVDAPAAIDAAVATEQIASRGAYVVQEFRPERHAKVGDIPYFYGRVGDDFADWLGLFERVARAYPWDDEQKARYIATYFREKAAQSVRSAE